MWFKATTKRHVGPQFWSGVNVCYPECQLLIHKTESLLQLMCAWIYFLPEANFHSDTVDYSYRRRPEGSCYLTYAFYYRKSRNGAPEYTGCEVVCFCLIIDFFHDPHILIRNMRDHYVNAINPLMELSTYCLLHTLWKFLVFMPILLFSPLPTHISPYSATLGSQWEVTLGPV